MQELHLMTWPLMGNEHLKNRDSANIESSPVWDISCMIDDVRILQRAKELSPVTVAN